MSISETVATEGFEIAESVMDLMLACETSWEYCQILVHHQFSGEHARGAQIFSLNNTAGFGLVATYGANVVEPGKEPTLWDGSAFAECVIAKRAVFRPASAATGGQALICLPLVKDQLPLGCISIVLDAEAKGLPFDPDWVPVMSRIGAFYLLHGARGAIGKPRSAEVTAPTPEDLTSRQLKILNLMADGLVNAEIAKELLVSESTVRQETVRIYRALAVPNRLEAATKGRALGLITRRVATPIGVE